MASVGTTSRQYDSAKGRNANYHVRIACTAFDVEIIADLPEELQTAVGSEWESRLPASLGAVPYVGEAVETASKIVGGSGVVQQKLSQQIWVNSSPMEIPLELQFDAQNDAYNDVYVPMRLLEMMALPDGVGGFLYSPGTNRGIAGVGESTISLHIGTMMYIPSIIITTVNSSFSSRLDYRGYPISGRSSVTFRTDRVVSRDEWKKYTNVR